MTTKKYPTPSTPHADQARRTLGAKVPYRVCTDAGAAVTITGRTGHYLPTHHYDSQKQPTSDSVLETCDADAPTHADSIAAGTNICPKYSKCNAPLCPLDPDMFKRTMLCSDAVCYYLTEAVKPGAEAIFRERGRIELFELVCKFIQPMSERWGRIHRHLERARKSGSRMARLAPWEVNHGKT
jgi:hypothetical protein